MLYLFRKLRHQLMQKNKTTTYLIYAFGEIILVVFGILIALWINNTNESRKVAKEEHQTLLALKSDFEVSRQQIEATITDQSRVISHSQLLLNIHENEDLAEMVYYDTNLDSLDNLISYGMSWYRAEIVTGAYTSLMSSGKIDLIQNQNLRHLMAQFMSDYEAGFEDQTTTMLLLDKLINETDDIILKISGSSWRTRFGLNARETDELEVAESFFTNERFFGALYWKFTLEWSRIRRQEKMLEQTNVILDLINQELAAKP